MKESYQDIRKLLEQFLSEQEAGQMTDDIRQADSLLSSVPTPRVSKETVTAIQNKVHRRLAVRRARVVHQRYFTAVAAMVLIAALAGFVFMIHSPAQYSGSITELSATFWSDDVDSKLTNQFDQISGQMEKLNQTATQWLDDNYNLSVEVENLEQIAANTDFWKG